MITIRKYCCKNSVTLIDCNAGNLNVQAEAKKWVQKFKLNIFLLNNNVIFEETKRIVFKIQKFS